MKSKNLYLVLSSECCGNRDPLSVAEKALHAGVDILQMREKNITHRELLSLGNKLSLLCKQFHALFIVNDNPLLAKELSADGVHLGQEDLLRFPLEETRRLLGREKIIGLSTHCLDQFIKANEQDFDYLAFGPVFPTKTKNYFIGTKDLEQVLKIALKPVVLIGGITQKNISKLTTMGAGNIAMIRAITEAPDISEAVRNFKEVLCG